MGIWGATTRPHQSPPAPLMVHAKCSSWGWEISWMITDTKAWFHLNDPEFLNMLTDSPHDHQETPLHCRKWNIRPYITLCNELNSYYCCDHGNLVLLYELLTTRQCDYSHLLHITGTLEVCFMGSWSQKDYTYQEVQTLALPVSFYGSS